MPRRRRTDPRKAPVAQSPTPSHGGLATADAWDARHLNLCLVAGSDWTIDMSDAVYLARQLAGLDAPRG
jgi:hypothetical protein